MTKVENNKRSKLVTLISIFLIFGPIYAIFIIHAITSVYDYATSDLYTLNATAQIIAVEKTEEYNESTETYDDWYRLTAEYVVDGQTYLYKDDQSEEPAIGESIALKVNPNEPKNARTSKEHKTISNPIYLLFSISFPPLLFSCLLIRIPFHDRKENTPR